MLQAIGLPFHDRCPTSRDRLAIIRQFNDYCENNPLELYPSVHSIDEEIREAES